MIKGIDIGNSITKDEKGYSFDSKTTYIENILGSKYKCELNSEVYYVGEGEYDTTYRKVDKNNYIKLLFAMLSISGALKNVQLMLGLPLSQYKEDRQKLKDKIKENFFMQGALNGIEKTFIVEDIEVYPEGVASLSKDYEGILVDIGGLTTDCCMVTNINNRLKIEKPISLPIGLDNNKLPPPVKVTLLVSKLYCKLSCLIKFSKYSLNTLIAKLIFCFSPLILNPFLIILLASLSFRSKPNLLFIKFIKSEYRFSVPVGKLIGFSIFNLLFILVTMQQSVVSPPISTKIPS